MKNDILDIIETALARAGYKILDGDGDTVIIRDVSSDSDYQVKVTEVAV